MVLHDKKIIFFHIPKAAGTSIERALLPTPLNGNVFHPEIVFGLHNKHMTQHLDYEGLKEYLPPDKLRSYFKFAFVRNTWDRLCSSYFYLPKFYEKSHGSFESWLFSACDSVLKKKYRNAAHIKPQIDYLFDNEGNLILDYIGRFENLQKDFNAICRQAHIKPATLKKINASKKDKPYPAYYTPAMVAAVQEAYAVEIRYFNFRFGDGL